MSHEAYVRGSLIAWSSSLAVTPAEMWAFDQSQFKSINGDEGGSWAPSSVITIGGQGFDVTGPFNAANVQAATFQSGALADIQSGAEVRFDSGSLMVGLSGSLTQWAGTFQFTSGAIVEFDTGVDPGYTAPRNYVKRGVELAWATTGAILASSTPTALDAWVGALPTTSGGQPSARGPVVFTKLSLTLTTEQMQLKLPHLIDGSTLTGVVLETSGPTGTPATYPTYIVIRTNALGGIVTLCSGGAVTDSHSPWSAFAATTIVCDQNNVIDLSQYTYAIHCTFPAVNSGSGANLAISDVAATYSVSKIRP